MNERTGFGSSPFEPVGGDVNHFRQQEESYSRYLEKQAVQLYKLAEDIRTVDGDHTLGAADLAEKLFELGWRKN